MSESLAEIYPVCCALLDAMRVTSLQTEIDAGTGPDSFATLLAVCPETGGSILPDLARIERALFQARSAPAISRPSIKTELNPTLALLEVSWRNLAAYFHQCAESPPHCPPGDDIILVWRQPGKNGKMQVLSADGLDLLALKLVVENLEHKEAAAESGVSLALLHETLDRAVERGILIKPQSKIVRTLSSGISDRAAVAPVFTLQWHITQSCDLHCRHCYDRSNRAPVSLEAGLTILDDLYDFCQNRHVWGQVSFTGGNPLLHPHFLEFYQAADERGLMTAILGNPTSRETLDTIRSIAEPQFFQVSLEGLEGHNDDIRGAGHYQRVLTFLDDLRDAGIFSMVMLTLTRDNLDQVLPLAEILRNRTDLFTFNRLSMVGEGAHLMTPAMEEYHEFLTHFLQAADANPVLAYKDNLINILLHKQGRELFGGCAGYGCGAAFNFVSLLADGEVHACRKFPSPLGNIFSSGLADIYDSKLAAEYRHGSSGCINCPIRQVCGGCLAVTHSHGLDIFNQRDPCCFIEDGEEYI